MDTLIATISAQLTVPKYNSIDLTKKHSCYKFNKDTFIGTPLEKYRVYVILNTPRVNGYRLIITDKENDNSIMIGESTTLENCMKSISCRLNNKTIIERNAFKI